MDKRGQCWYVGLIFRWTKNVCRADLSMDIKGQWWYVGLICPWTQKGSVGLSGWFVHGHKRAVFVCRAGMSMDTKGQCWYVGLICPWAQKQIQSRYCHTEAAYDSNKQWLYSFFWVTPRRLNFLGRRFGTLCSIFICRLNKKNLIICLNDLWRWNRQSVPKRRYRKIQTPGNRPKERIQHSQHGESLKSRVNSGLSAYTTVKLWWRKRSLWLYHQRQIVKLYLQNLFKFKECNDLSKTIISKCPSKAIIPAVWINGSICENVTWPGQFFHGIFNGQSISNRIYCCWNECDRL